VHPPAKYCSCGNGDGQGDGDVNDYEYESMTCSRTHSGTAILFARWRGKVHDQEQANFSEQHDSAGKQCTGGERSMESDARDLCVNRSGEAGGSFNQHVTLPPG
jgi:hypothetical protein